MCASFIQSPHVWMYGRCVLLRTLLLQQRRVMPFSYLSEQADVSMLLVLSLKLLALRSGTCMERRKSSSLLPGSLGAQYPGIRLQAPIQTKPPFRGIVPPLRVPVPSAPVPSAESFCFVRERSYNTPALRGDWFRVLFNLYT